MHLFLSSFHLPSLGFSLLSWGYLLCMHRWKHTRPKSCTWIHYVPDVLIWVIVSTCLCYGLNGPDWGVLVLGSTLSSQPIPSMWQGLGGERSWRTFLPSWTLMSNLLLPSLMLSTLGMVESLAIAKHCAREHQYELSKNRELVALGLANVVGGVLGSCFPVFGSLTRSHLNAQVGAKTQAAGWVTGVCMWIVLKGFLPWLYYLPQPVMATLIAYSALALFQKNEVVCLLQLRAYKEIAFCLLVTLVTLVHVEAGLCVCIGVSLILVVAQTTTPRYLVLTPPYTSSCAGCCTSHQVRAHHEGLEIEEEHLDHDEEQDFVSPSSSSCSSSSLPTSPESPYASFSSPLSSRIPGVLILSIEEPLHFANTSAFIDRIQRLIKFGGVHQHPSEPPPFHPYEEQIHYVVLDMRHVPWMDPCAIFLFKEWLVHTLNRNQIHLSLVKVKKKVRHAFQLVEIHQSVFGNRYFRSLHEAVGYIQEQQQQQQLQPPHDEESRGAEERSPLLHNEHRPVLLNSCTHRGGSGQLS
ncbi:Solute carrier 26 [Coelomomyces lativittatus]|nr:Solute carrier 26 [Coelomomyces lativittatus]KAJ1514375.1 Solute carrier 26 [Coelomomyces lativittatus]